MQPDIESDARFADLAKIRQARAMSPEEKFLAGAELFEEACEWSLAGIAHRFPHLSEAQRMEKLRRSLESAEPPPP
ncbi:MAG: hypothetical protein NWT08_14995 [Akkermansiaceae bacterium]|jgi:hypothetical protein|nr:hypothetical protein [Akkermansiaceae bacterium]MDP4646585.1 hypothetical protein [Akkermansiaceae bacterium]MDP4720804.1 hypothetical protein [Akkermansiaceae bacterium]MDP4846418.1 hypothetical protein [Akkermansiaceae bacterium]MDP4896719.1 hypothetical protein [Akkermansiaceae bacterium]